MTDKVNPTNSTKSKKSTTSPTPPKKRERKLSVADINKMVKEVSEYSTYVIDESTNTVIKYNKVFDESEIENLVTELYEHIVDNSTREYNVFPNDYEFNKYVNFLIIKYFTHFKEQWVDNDLEDNILRMHQLAKLKLFKIFFDEIFEPDQVARVHDFINERVELKYAMEKQLLTIQSELVDKVTSPEFIEKMENLKLLNEDSKLN